MEPIEAKNFILEEYKNVKVRIESHERHWYQMLVLSVTAMAAILGLSDKLPHELIPYISASVLFVTTAVATVQKIHQSFDTAYLLERFESTTFPSFERTYDGVFVNRLDRAPQKRRRLIGILLRPLSYVYSPFVALAGVSLMFSVFFGWRFVVDVWTTNRQPIAAAYVGMLAILHLLCLHNVVRAKRFNTNYYREQCREVLSRDKIRIRE